MGLFTFIATGICFVLVGGYEGMTSSNLNRKEHSNSLPSSAVDPIHLPTQSRKSPFSSSSSSLSFKFVSVLSLLFITNSSVSLIDAMNSADGLGFAIQLQVLAIEFLFLLYSVAGILFNFLHSSSFPSWLVCLIGLFAFAEEFLLFYLQRKDPDGVENRYYDHMLVPISICFFSTMFELKYPKSNVPKLSRGIGLILQGTWFMQMGVSFFSGLLAQGCSLDRKTRGNYTIKCNEHPDYHRARAIATLQFNCHLALLVTFIVGAYSMICKKRGDQEGSFQYKPIVAEMHSFENRTHFTLDSDDDMEEEIRQEHNVA